MANPTQRQVDELFLGQFGHFGCFLDEEDVDCQVIIQKVKEAFGISLSVSEAYVFWKWRSEKYDASWLNMHPDEVSEWFLAFISEFCGLDEEVV